MALRGGASMGQELALLTFTNTQPTTCRLSGYPTVTLSASGRTLGHAKPAQTTGSGSVTLARNDAAQVRLHVNTNCSAPQSDQVHVAVPGRDASMSAPLELRGCTLFVEAFRPAG